MEAQIYTSEYSIPTISLVGRSNSGKTTFIEKLIGYLQEKDIDIAIAKQHRHDVDVDVRGKDSWRYGQAGAGCSIISTPTQLSVVHRRNKQASLVDIASLAAQSGYDLLLAESFGEDDTVDRYVVARKERDEGPRLSPTESKAIITDDPELADRWQGQNRLAFDLNDPAAFAQYLLTTYVAPA